MMNWSTHPFIQRGLSWRTDGMNISRAQLLTLTMTAGFILPAAIPSIGLDYPYFFIFALVLFAWFLIKWESIRSITSRSRTYEVLLGVAAIGADYSFNAVRGSRVGLVDFMIIFLASVAAIYGFRAFKLFWVPVAYGIVLLAGYQIENILPNYVALQDWLAGVMVGSMNALGIGAALSGHLVTLTQANGTPLTLDIASDCTGLQGILAFGMLSTMALLDMKPRISRLVPLFAVGFLGAFLINIVRLVVVFLTFEYLGVDAGTTMHVYFGYIIFIVWVLAFWAIAFRYLGPPRGSLPPQTAAMPSIRTPAGP